MMTAGGFLRVSFAAFLMVITSGIPIKSSKPSQLSGGDGSAYLAAYQGAPSSHSAPVLYNPAGAVSAPVYVFQEPSEQTVAQSGPVLSSLSSTMPFVRYTVPAASAGLVQAEHVAYPQLEAGESDSSETQWAVAPNTFSEDASADALDPSDFLPPLPQPPAVPDLQSGERLSIVKEAELGNYQQQTEEFGYPFDQQSPEQGFASLVVPHFGLGGFGGFLSPNFDYRLVYGLYPPGTQTTFSRHHETGKDYNQAIHYLKEHSSDDQGPVQQRKVFQVSS
ncbi:uncharacterized protein LOC133447364 [Cololabis saira]|uniref:uncharacterized protein LOC133447364 n=1 Tax=Cololabis saira TaxID=129043 RepID=UPI002AD44C6E|nr:uncharacterized protein LOC133447364 [Cololabis saira]